MYKLSIEYYDGRFEHHKFTTDSERNDYILSHWTDEADYWLSYGNFPAFEIRDIR